MAKTVDFIKENDKYYFTYDKKGLNLHVRYEVNSTTITVNGEKEITLDKPFENIREFEKFCVETDLF